VAHDVRTAVHHSISNQHRLKPTRLLPFHYHGVGRRPRHRYVFCRLGSTCINATSIQRSSILITNISPKSFIVRSAQTHIFCTQWHSQKFQLRGLVSLFPSFFSPFVSALPTPFTFSSLPLSSPLLIPSLLLEVEPTKSQLDDLGGALRAPPAGSEAEL